jgi:hypothetical protein
MVQTIDIAKVKEELLPQCSDQEKNLREKEYK